LTPEELAARRKAKAERIAVMQECLRLGIPFPDDERFPPLVINEEPASLGEPREEPPVGLTSDEETELRELLAYAIDGGDSDAEEWSSNEEDELRELLAYAIDAEADDEAPSPRPSFYIPVEDPDEPKPGHRWTRDEYRAMRETYGID
jgi:hypothetical protein